MSNCILQWDPLKCISKTRQLGIVYTDKLNMVEVAKSSMGDNRQDCEVLEERVTFKFANGNTNSWRIVLITINMIQKNQLSSICSCFQIIKPETFFFNSIEIIY